MQKDTELTPVGFVESSYNTKISCPANGWASTNPSTIVIYERYHEAISGLSIGDMIHVLWLFDNTNRSILKQSPRVGESELGVFAMRCPERPNPIAMSICKIIDIRIGKLLVKGLECIANSRVVDIKKAVNFDSKVL